MSGTSSAPVVRRWSRHPRCVSRARAELLVALEVWGLAPLADSATLVLSELLTNAGRHARVPPGRLIETRFQAVRGGLRIEVHDAAGAPPQKRDPDVDACDGRGLLLVTSLTDSWGFGERNGPGKVVWAELGTCEAPGEGDGDAP
ncbi:ATP-binding protein [Streptomyces sp. NBC_00727]|uniref:ATP-binding protein n=1 Tax=Streptomyces sp. NBC_00727 TaxID=2903675 RepID=UPI00386F46F8